MATAPLYGDPVANAPVWGKYVVLLGSLTATIPVHPAAWTLNDGATVTNMWDPVGDLDEDSPFSDGEESIDETSHTSANHGVYAKTFKNQEETIEFTALEKTLVTLGIVYDASGLTNTSGTIKGTLKQRDPQEKMKVAFQRENDTQLERRTSVNYAQINSVTRNFADGATTYTVACTIYPNANKELYDFYIGPKS